MTGPYHPDVPFFYPCSALLLDDDEDFLESLRSVLSRDAAVLGYSSVHDAQKRLAHAQSIAEETFDLFARYGNPAEGRGAEIGDHLLLLKSSRLRRLAMLGSRFEMISVVIVDQVMPMTSGLEFCRSIEDTGVKTIMLTGQMSDSATIAAFNDGLIDRFVSKKDPNALEKIKAMMAELHREFLSEKLEPLTKALKASGSHWMVSQELVTLMRSIYETFPYTEYYYLPSPGGFLLRDKDGTERFCLLGRAKEQIEIGELVEETLGDCAESRGLRDGSLMAWDFFDDFGEELLWQDRLADLLFPCSQNGDLVWAVIPAQKMPYRTAFEARTWGAFREKILKTPTNWLGDISA